MSSDGSIYHFHIKPSLHHTRPWSSSRNVFTADEAIFPASVKDVSFYSCNTASHGGGDCQEDEDSQDRLKDFHFSEVTGDDWVMLSETLSLQHTEAPPENWNIYSKSTHGQLGTGWYNVFVHLIYLLSVLYYLILGQIVTVLFVMSVLFSGQQVRHFIIFSELIIIHISASPDLFYKSTYITSIIYN